MKKCKFVALLAFMAFVGISSADLVSITVRGKADTTKMGYLSGHSYSFTWVLNDTYTGSPWDEYSASKNQWYVQESIYPALWDSVHGSGLSGTYVRPSPWNEDYLSINSQLDTDQVNLTAEAPVTDIGLTVNGVKVAWVAAINLRFSEFSFPETFSNPANYMTGYLGTYTPSDGFMRVGDINGNNIYFTATSVEVVPEPSSALLLVVGSGGILLYRRTRERHQTEIPSRRHFFQ